MKYIIFAILGFNNLLFSQNLWRQELDWLPSNEATYRPQLPLVHHNYIYVSHRFGDTLVVDQLNFSGNILQRKYYSSNSPGQCMGIFLTLTPNNNLKLVDCVLDGQIFKISVLNVDSTLQTSLDKYHQFSRSINVPDFNLVTFFNDSSFALTGRHFNTINVDSYPLVLYIDAKRKLYFVKEYENSKDGTSLYSDTFNFISYGKNKNEFIAGVGNLFLKLMRLDSNLNAKEDIELFPFSSSGLASFWPVDHSSNNGSYQMAGLFSVPQPIYYQSGIVWLDSLTLTPTDSILLPNPTTTEKWFVRHCKISNGGTLAVDNQTYIDWTNPNEKRAISMHKISANKQIEWVRMLPSKASYFHVGSSTMPNGDAVIVNRFYKNGSYKLEVFTIDSQGNFIGLRESKSLSGRVKLFPNPVKNTLSIEIEQREIESIFIYDLQGHLVKELILANENKVIDVSGLAQGSYLLIAKFKNGEYHSIDKLVKL